VYAIKHSEQQYNREPSGDVTILTSPNPCLLFPSCGGDNYKKMLNI